MRQPEILENQKNAGHNVLEKRHIVFAAPRFHTNQSALISRLVEDGHKVEFWSLFEGVTEDHSVICPELLCRSRLFRKRSVCREERKPGHGKMPSAREFYRKIIERRPDILVLRSLGPTSRLLAYFARFSGVKVLGYDQKELESPGEKWSRPQLFNPVSVTFTPVVERWVTPGQYNALRTRRFIPFAVDADEFAWEREYCVGGMIRFLCVGKLNQRRKRHDWVLKALSCADGSVPFHLTFAGSLEKHGDYNYYDFLLQEIDTLGIAENVTILENHPYKKMRDLYLQNDVCLYPSADERAGIAHIEAMAHGLPAVCSDTNGTASYICNGSTGYVFAQDDFEGFCTLFRKLMRDKRYIADMGQNALNWVYKCCSPAECTRLLLSSF